MLFRSAAFPCVTGWYRNLRRLICWSGVPRLAGKRGFFRCFEVLHGTADNLPNTVEERVHLCNEVLPVVIQEGGLFTICLSKVFEKLLYALHELLPRAVEKVVDRVEERLCQPG